MQAPTGYQQMNASTPAFPEQEHLKCPRCDSDNTKFCYYNNYNLSQPRHFCKNCRRYWTKGGSLRNIPVGGVTRKTTTKRSSSSSSTTITNNNPKRQTPNQNIPDPSPPPPPPKPTSSLSSTFPQQAVLNLNSSIDPTRLYPLAVVDHQDGKMMDIGGNSFSSLLASSEQFGTVLEGLSSNGSALKPVDDFGWNLDSGQDPELGESSNNKESYWSGDNNDWPDLSIYTPSSSFRR